MRFRRRWRPPAVLLGPVLAVPLPAPASGSASSAEAPLAAVGRPTLVALAIVATLLTVALFVDALRPSRRPRDMRRDRRERAVTTARRDPGEALALVGDALAATHNPRALLPVILEVVTEATGARGGRIVSDGEDVSWTGVIDAGAGSVVLELARDDGVIDLVLYPPEGGFDPDSRRLAEWLASQAAIALENARLHHTVQRQAITDELTGLVNRRRFIEALGSEIVRAQTLGTPLSVVLADLDEFKLVNDRLGHQAGDGVLRRFAEHVRSHLREVDVPGRLGGEEFAILVPETDATGAAAVAERVRESLVAANPAADAGVGVTASFGVAQLVPGETGDELLRRADVALYQAKSAGRNTVAVAGCPSSART